MAPKGCCKMVLAMSQKGYAYSAKIHFIRSDMNYLISSQSVSLILHFFSANKIMQKFRITTYFKATACTYVVLRFNSCENLYKHLTYTNIPRCSINPIFNHINTENNKFSDESQYL